MPSAIPDNNNFMLVEVFVLEFEKTFYVRETWVRISPFTHLYTEMAQDAYGNYLHEMDNSVDKPSFEDDPAAWLEQDDRLTKFGVQAIIFTAMALEAGVFDLAAINLGDELASGNLDKLTLEGKWSIIPELVCGRSLREKGPALNSLKSLVQARNRLVHHKSKSMPSGDNLEVLASALSVAEKASEKFKQDVLLSFKALILISLELNDLMGISSPLPNFSKECLSLNRHAIKSKRISKIIERCWGIHRNTFLSANI